MDNLEKAEKVGEVVWDIKKIVLGVVSLTTVATGGYVIKQNYFSDNPPVVVQEAPRDVKGISTENSSKPESKYSISNIGTEVQKQLDTLKNEANNLNAAEVATSSPQVQQVIKDLQELEQYPKNQAKEACMRICNGL